MSEVERRSQLCLVWRERTEGFRRKGQTQRDIGNGKLSRRALGPVRTQVNLFGSSFDHDWLWKEKEGI